MEMDQMVDHDDGRIRTGTIWTATTHAITAVIGSGVLALPWSVAQLGWVVGPIVLIACAYITYYTAVLLCDCYRTPDPVKGKRNYTYMDVVRSSLVVRLNCYHTKGHDADCKASGTIYMIIFGLVEIVLSQFPNLDEITIISVIAAIMSFAYLLIALALSIAKLASHRHIQGTLLGVKIGGVGGVSALTKVWQCFQALGNVAFAYTFAMLLIEIQDTLKSMPAENKTMKKASFYGIGVTGIFYVALGCLGYAAFGNEAPGLILTGFYEPFWLVDIAHAAVLIHIVGAFQVYAQPIFAKYEEYLCKKYPNSTFFHKNYKVPLFSKSRSFNFTLCKLILRSLFVVLTTFIALLLPFFNAIVGLLGSVSFWPLTVYFPVTMYIKQANIRRGTGKWLMLQLLSLVSLIISLVAAVGSIADIGQKLKHAKLFKAEL